MKLADTINFTLFLEVTSSKVSSSSGWQSSQGAWIHACPNLPGTGMGSYGWAFATLPPLSWCWRPPPLRIIWTVLVEAGLRKFLLKQSVGKAHRGSFSLLTWMLWKVPLYLKAASSSPAITGAAYREGTFLSSSGVVGGCCLLNGRWEMTGCPAIVERSPGWV